MATQTLELLCPGGSPETGEEETDNPFSPQHVLREGLVQLYRGDSLKVLAVMQTDSVDCCITSPPYWGLREYDDSTTLGNEPTPQAYIGNLVAIFREVRRVLKPQGSLWLNLGDTYVNKGLQGIPWRVALALQDDGWLLRQDIVWDKCKGNPDTAKDKLRVVHEYVFHLVKSRNYFYDIDAVRAKPNPAVIQANGTVVTATGVSGSRYRTQITASTQLTKDEKKAAIAALDATLGKVRSGEVPDFRMLIRGEQRATHGDKTELSGRAKELEAHGFAILPYHKKGSKPGSIWRINPESGASLRMDKHTAVYPEELCRLPILTTCPVGGVVLDPFLGSGTTSVAAINLGRKSIGVEASKKYLTVAAERIQNAIDALPAAGTA